MTDKDAVKKRLVWHCRRGSKELDLILSTFVHDHYDHLNESEQQLFALLLESPDPQLAGWLHHGVQPTNQGMETIVKRILSASRSSSPTA